MLTCSGTYKGVKYVLEYIDTWGEWHYEQFKLYVDIPPNVLKNANEINSLLNIPSSPNQRESIKIEKGKLTLTFKRPDDPMEVIKKFDLLLSVLKNTR